MNFVWTVLCRFTKDSALTITMVAATTVYWLLFTFKTPKNSLSRSSARELGTIVVPELTSTLVLLQVQGRYGEPSG